MYPAPTSHTRRMIRCPTAVSMVLSGGLPPRQYCAEESKLAQRGGLPAEAFGVSARGLSRGQGPKKLRYSSHNPIGIEGGHQDTGVRGSNNLRCSPDG